MIKVLIVDDSELIRQMLTEILSQSDDLQVVGTAEDPFDARDKIKLLNPDVLTLDVEMPKMDGVSFLKNIMRLRPMPVVMISSLTETGAPVTLDALAIGAVDYIAKPKGDTWKDLSDYADLIRHKVRVAAKANMSAKEHSPAPAPSIERAKTFKPRSSNVIVVGSSTGGTEAIKELLESMPANSPPILIVQHIPAAFSITLAERLNKSCEITVNHAAPGMVVEQGNAYIAPGDSHMILLENRKGPGYRIGLRDDEPVAGHKPSVDVLFDSASKLVGKNLVSAVLTGMGRDGADGSKMVLDQGGKTIAQDEATSVVWGMPGEVVKRGFATQVLPLQKIAYAILDYCRVD